MYHVSFINSRFYAAIIISNIAYIANGDVEQLDTLLSNGADPEEGDYDMRSPLHVAAAEGRFTCVDLLLKYNMDPCILDRWDSSPMVDAVKGGH